MHITVQRKSLGRSRKLLPVSYELPSEPQTLRELLHVLVDMELARYSSADTLLHFLTEDEEAGLAARGQVKFSALTPHDAPSVEKSIHVMELAFEDGLFKVLQGSFVYTSLDEQIQPGELAFTFIKLTFLAGR